MPVGLPTPLHSIPPFVHTLEAVCQAKHYQLCPAQTEEILSPLLVRGHLL